MTYVITQPCCADASCVVACPVNCIHPAPGEPGFAEAEMLYVDPQTCVGCGACATACPADAIVPDWTLSDAQRPFLALNSAFYEAIPQGPRTPMWRMPAQRRVRQGGPFRVAVVGAGPAGLYTAAELLAHPEITVDVYDRLPAPHGLVRYGVAPDHRQTKQASGLFEYIENTPGFRYRLGVELGRDVRHDELLAAYHAVFYCVGAASDRTLGVPGEHLPGSVSATDVVGWYNGHPDKQGLDVRLDHERAVVIGNGNVALDVARILTRDPRDLESTDIADEALAALRTSAVREVVVLGRRGPAAASFTLPELIGLAGIEDLNVVIDSGAPIVSEGPRDSARVQLLAELAARPHRRGLRTVVLRFDTRVVRILGDDRVRGVEVERGDEVRGRRLHGVGPCDVEEDRGDLRLVGAEERTQPRGRLQRDGGRECRRLVHRVAEQQQRHIAGLRVAIGPHLAAVAGIVALTGTQERDHRGSVPQCERQRRHVLSLQRIGQLGVAELQGLRRPRALLTGHRSSLEPHPDHRREHVPHRPPEKGGPLDPHIGDWEDREGQSSPSGMSENRATGVGAGDRRWGRRGLAFRS